MMIEALIQYEYMQNAVLGAFFASVMAGALGTIIVEKKLVSMSGGIAHASFGGMGAGYFVGISPIVGAFVFAILASLGVAFIHRRVHIHADTVINMFWASGMALGVLFISFTPGYPPDLGSYLFGDILTIGREYLWGIVGITGIVLFSIYAYYHYWALYLFDENYAGIIGIPVRIFEIFLYILIALSVVALVRVVGIILSIAMLSIPPAIAKLISIDLKRRMVISSVISTLLSLTGLSLSYYLNIASGATIILLSMLVYLFVHGISGKISSKVS